MSKYLEMLKAKSQQKHLPNPPAKPSKGSSEGFEGDLGKSFSPHEVKERAIDAFEERAAICEFDGGMKSDHAEVLAALHAVPLPEGVNENQRNIVIDAAAKFLDRQRRR